MEETDYAVEAENPEKRWGIDGKKHRHEMGHSFYQFPTKFSACNSRLVLRGEGSRETQGSLNFSNRFINGREHVFEVGLHLKTNTRKGSQRSPGRRAGLWIG